MPEHFPFRKLPGKKRQIDLKGIARHSLMGSLENKTRCPVVGESQKALAQDLCLPVAEKWLPMMKLWAARWDAGCGEAQGGGHCSPLLASPSARGDACFWPAICITLPQSGAAKITWAGLNTSCILMTPVPLQAENTRWLPLPQSLPRF